MQSTLVQILISTNDPRAAFRELTFLQDALISTLRRSVNMLHRICVSAGFTLLLSLGSSAEAQTVAENGPNFVGVELLGRAFLYSINYERYITPRFGIGAGLATWEINNRVIAIVPMYASVTPIGHTHSPYFTAGMTLGVRASTFYDNPTAALGTVGAGYQYISNRGFVIRPTLHVVFDRQNHAFWPGIMIGRRF
jgi:hypothetical protein